MAYGALVALFISSILYGVSDRHHRLPGIARILAAVATVLLGAVLVDRSIRIGFPALTGSYEGMLLLAAALSGSVAIGERTLYREHRVLSALVIGVAFVVVAVLSSPVVSPELRPPMPVLRSGWLVVHVAFAFVGIALMTVGMIAAVAGAAMKDASAADRLRDRSIAFGFVFYATGGLVFGAIWAEAAWGRFWGWDPKETWALVTTIVYAVYLHLRYMQKVRVSTVRILAVAAWIIAIFTLFGVNYLFTGLHSYA